MSKVIRNADCNEKLGGHSGTFYVSMWGVHLTYLNLDSCKKDQNFALLGIGRKYTLVEKNIYLTSSYPPFYSKS